MDYEPYDSSGFANPMHCCFSDIAVTRIIVSGKLGTDDDLPPRHQNRMSRGGRIAGNGRPTAMGSQVPYSRMYDGTDMEAKLHQLEQEAYSSVLRAFKAQADAISWEKESLMTELRKELRLSNEEHRDLLSRYPAGPAGRGQFGNNRISSGGHANGPAEGGSFDPLIGRKVRTRWPDDNTFYEAVISDYNPVEGRHALVYDIDDIKWDGEDPGVSRHGHGGYGGPGRGMGRPRDNNAPGSGPSGRGRGLTKSQPRKDFPPSQNGIGNKGPDDIQLLHTDTLIKETRVVVISCMGKH
ncbi:hypothetical protein PHJA_001457300 [Phtheirospermum japonicum]|uniref:ENT domain-containing protein n=1 Tax=Phtheirospermum japonicum TaxID=374723 RepID=A0A830C0D3_9LAMI|nr:hypothetical protein PHJA_001457300 [Phtheirospermum japonicum]